MVGVTVAGPRGEDGGVRVEVPVRGARPGLVGHAHPAVGQAEEDDLVHAQPTQARSALLAAGPGQPVGGDVGLRVRGLPVTGDHDHDGAPGGDEVVHQPADPERLVIGMGGQHHNPSGAGEVVDGDVGDVAPVR